MSLYYKIRGFFRDGWWKYEARWQRFLRGYAWADVWNIDNWFIKTLEPMLRHLQKHGMSHPIEYTDEEWQQTLGKMADHLHLMDEWHVIDEVYDGDYMNKGIKTTMEEHKDKFFELFVKEFYNMWD